MNIEGFKSSVTEYEVDIMSHYKRIFIIGQPGAGKALLAKSLAEKLGWDFIDADLGLEIRIGRSINEIMGSAGLKAFDNSQIEILSSQLHKENIVVTTDASIVDDEKICESLSNELVVFLHVNLPVQLERLSRNPAPLLKTDLKNFLETLHQQRDEQYEFTANVTIDGSDSALENHVQAIIELCLKDQETKQCTVKNELKEKDLAFFHKQTHKLVHLTEQQAQCFQFLSQGKSSKEIARDLHLSHRTVDWNLAKIMETLGCSSSKELIALYHEKP